MASLAANREGIADGLRQGPYAQPALPPATPWLAEQPPARPQVTITPAVSGVDLAWHPSPNTPPWRQAVLHVRSAGRWDTLHWPVPGTSRHSLGESVDRAVLQGVGRTGLVSEGLALIRHKGHWPSVG
jgi:hypothetical protein